ncbi:MAG: 3-deoxy-7-phosphoheptulonate synthase [Planctomycetota bacterium]
MPVPSAPMELTTQNLNVVGLTPLRSPSELEAELPASASALEAVAGARQAIQDILMGKDGRLLVVVGPCSIHDTGAALEYAGRLRGLAERVSDRMLVVMRAYFEKPRTTMGWKGLINDPHLDGTFDMQTGLRRARKLLIDIAELGLPTGTELLEPITPQFLDDLLAWAAVGARTTESQTHRQMASGLSMPVGFKNATNGNLQVALDAMQAARNPHHFLGINEEGRTCVVATRGNAFGHVILRGGAGRPNYDPGNVADAAAGLEAAGLNPLLMVDCSHANSGKQHARQSVVWESIIEQRRAAAVGGAGGGVCPIIGAMIESFLEEGNQKLTDPTDLLYGVSVTDACVGWDATERMLIEGYERLV